MYYALSKQQEDALLLQPETGMGYQVIEAGLSGSYAKKKYVILNSEIAIEMDGDYGLLIKNVISEGIAKIKFKASSINFSASSIKVYSEKDFRSIVNEGKTGNENGALDNPEEFANGTEDFVRLSAFQDDKRIDKVKKCLRPGSFATTKKDYLVCRNQGISPIERYALPNEEKIAWAFFIIPEKSDTLQRGKVQPANNKAGGGEEAYFAKGTSEGTFKIEMKY